MTYAIRPFCLSDADYLVELRRLSIEQIGLVAYSSQQVLAWSAKIGSAADLLARVHRGDMVTVACDQQDRAIAYTLLEPDGHLDHLYCHPDHTGTGLADRLLAQSETLARRANAARLYTEASELARPVFLRAGYKVTERRDFSIEFNGRSVPIHNYAMVKPLK